MTDFEVFRKIPRLNRDIVITEKIDGTNAQIFIELWPSNGLSAPGAGERDEEGALCVFVNDELPAYRVMAGSRNRWITPEKDNFGFARWVYANAEQLVKLLGEGRHYGEWWGSSIQRTYGLTGKRFSLFNVHKWGAKDYYLDPRCVRPAVPHGPEAEVEHKFHNGQKMCACTEGQDAVLSEVGGVLIQPVPKLYEGPWFIETIGGLTWAPTAALGRLKSDGSVAAPGFLKPEGIVVFHTAGSVLFKVTLENDEKPKGSTE